MEGSLAKERPGAVTPGSNQKRSYSHSENSKPEEANQRRDSLILACDAVLEIASALIPILTALIAAAACADVAEVEARLWEMRRLLTAAIVSWREAVPAHIEEGGR